jgi:hypothetical protein
MKKRIMDKTNIEDILDFLEGNLEPFDFPAYTYIETDLTDSPKYIREDIVIQAMKEYTPQNQPDLLTDEMIEKEIGKILEIVMPDDDYGREINS